MKQFIQQIVLVCLLLICVSSCSTIATQRGETLLKQGCIYCIVYAGMVSDLDKCNEQNKDNIAQCEAIFEQLRKHQ